MQDEIAAGRKQKSPLDILYIITGTFVSVCYIIYAVSCVSKAMYQSLFLPILVLALVIVPVLLRNKIKKIAPRLYLPCEILFVCGMTLYTVTFLLFSGIILTRSQTYEGGNADDRTPVVIVFGCRTNGYEPSRALQKRLDRAAEILHENSAAICIVSGSQGANETVPEAESMKKYLVERCGVAPGRVTEEDQANSSVENLSYSLAIIEEKKIDARIICVSSAFHTPRIMLLSHRAGVQVETAGAALGSIGALWADLVREYMAYVKLFVFENG